MKYLITLNKQDDIKKVKCELVSLIKKDKHPDMLVIAEVFNKHISKILVSIYCCYFLLLTFVTYIFR